MLSRKGYGCVCPLLGFFQIPKEMIEKGNTVADIGQAGGVGQFLSQRKRLDAPCEGLVRVTQIPEHEGCTAEANHALVLAKERNMRTMLKGIIMGNSLLEVLP